MLATDSEFLKHFERAKLNTSVGQNQLVRINESSVKPLAPWLALHIGAGYEYHGSLGPGGESSYQHPPEGLLRRGSDPVQ